MSGRSDILGAVRRALGHPQGDTQVEAEVRHRLAEPQIGPIPAFARLEGPALVNLFVERAGALKASVARLADMEAVPQAVAAYLAAENLPAELRLSPHPLLEELPWGKAPLLSRSSGPAREGDPVSLGLAFAGIAETGTLALVSGAETSTTLNFLPDTALVVLRGEDLVGPKEALWPKLRAAFGQGRMPRTVNLISGPSRTADVEQMIVLGAHGPRRLHILLVGAPAE